jgi:tetratricopeptide (TPR) repeat protein
LNLLQSDLKAAEQDCQQIERYFGRQEALLHRAVLQYRTGQSELAIRTFNEILQNAAFAKQTDLEWVNFQLGEAYRVAGQNVLALSVWKKQLTLTPQSHLIRLSLAELLNQQGMFAEAQKVSTIDTPSDALLVQSLLASRGLKDRNEVKLDKLIAARLATQALRNESLIERPKLIYLIDYGKDPVAGLKLSIDNWQLQQEPRDAVLFVKAALLTQQASSAQPVLAWAEKTKYTDPQLAALLLQLKHKLKGQGVTP